MADKPKEIRLQVREAQQDEAFKGIVRIDSEMLKDIGIRPGDIVEIEGSRKTVAIADRAYPTDIGVSVIRMDGIMRRNAKTAIGENVLVRRADIKEAKEISVAPAEKGMMVSADPSIFKRGLIGRALCKGDIVVLGGAKLRRRTMTKSPYEEIFKAFEDDFMGHFGFSNIRFIIADTNPKQPVIVSDNTTVKVIPHAVEISEERVPEVTYEDIGGLAEEIKKVREMVELPLKHPELFERLGVQPPKGVLLHGPPGTGKTLLAKAVANESEAKFFSINGPEITSKFVGEAEKRIRDIFDEAEKSAPSIIFIDEIDAIAAKREEVYGEVEKRIVAQLLATMDGLKTRGKVIVMAATNRPNAIDPALRRPGRFDREIEIGVPSKEGRLSVLKIHTRNMPLKYWDDPVACNLLMKRLSSFEEEALAKINQKKTMSNQLNNEFKEKNKLLEESMAELRKLEQQKKESHDSFLADLLAKINFKQGKIADFKKQIEKTKSELENIPKDIKKIEGDISVGKELLKEIEKDKSFLLELEAKLKEIIHIKEMRSFEDARTLFLNKDLKEAQNKLKSLVDKFMGTDIVSGEFIGEIYKESTPVLLKGLAQRTYGFVGADLESLCKEAAMNVVRRVLPNVNLEEDVEIPADVLEKLVITPVDFDEAMKVVGPSALREVLIDIPNIKWEQIGGLAELKQELKEAIEWPLKYPDSFKRMGVRPPRGVLMYGPPGCGKTLLAKAAANESEANFILVKGPELISKWVGESLPYDEELIVRKDGKILRMKIGNIVENKEDVEVLSFDKDKRVNFSRIEDHIKHKATSNMLEITTRTGRKIKATSDHSVFSFINGKFCSIPSSYLVPGESCIAVPKRLNLPRERVKELDLYEAFKNDKSVFVGNVKEYISKAKKILGLKRAAELLGVSRKMIYDIPGKNLPVPITPFHALMNEAKLAVDINEIEVKLKGSIHSYPARFKIDEDFWRLAGVWTAEGDLNGYTVRIHNMNSEIREDIKNICGKYGFSASVTEKAITINSRLLQGLFRNVLGMDTGAYNKRIPPMLFALDKQSKANFLKGYFSGDGSIYGAERGKFLIEASTVSKELANDLMYLLLDFGIVATIYKKKEWSGSASYRISILGVRNFETFRQIGFIDQARNSRIGKYIESRNWVRTELIPLSGELYSLASQNATVSAAIGKERLKQILVYVDKDKVKYKEYWDLVDGDIFFDKVKEIKKIDNEEYVYDISVPDGQNFVAGFGGVFAHNSEKGLREIFKKARQSSPTIIFFDEIDSIAPRRGQEIGTHVTERMVNQLLTEMDGLEELQDVIVLAATNRPDILDPGLLRPGRFDRIILVPVPDAKAREEIFKIHMKGMPLTKDVKVQKLVERTENYVGADVEALCREAATIALRQNIDAKDISMKHFEEALKKVKSSIVNEDIQQYKEIENNYIRKARSVSAKEAEGKSYFG